MRRHPVPRLQPAIWSVFSVSALVACSIYSEDLIQPGQDTSLGPVPSNSHSARSTTPVANTFQAGNTGSISTDPSGAIAAGDPSSRTPQTSGTPGTNEPVDAPGSPSSQTEPGTSEPPDASVAEEGDSSSSSPKPTTAPTPTANTPFDATLIDDFENGDLALASGTDRTGFWFTSAQLVTGSGLNEVATTCVAPPSTTKCTVTANDDMIANPGHAGERSAHVIASGLFPTSDHSHAGLGVHFLRTLEGMDPEAYPGAEDYVGVSVWAKIGSDTFDGSNSGNQPIRFEVPLTTTQLTSDHYYKDITVGTNWGYFEVRWANPKFSAKADLTFKRTNFDGKNTLFDVKEVTGIQFHIVSLTATGLDLWLDDVHFIPPPAVSATTVNTATPIPTARTSAAPSTTQLLPATTTAGSGTSTAISTSTASASATASAH